MGKKTEKERIIPIRPRGRQKGWKAPGSISLPERLPQTRVRKDTLDWLAEKASGQGETVKIATIVREIIEQAQKMDQQEQQ